MASSCPPHSIDPSDRARAKASKAGVTVKCKDCGKRLRLKSSGESIKDEAKMEESKLSSAARKALPKSAYVFPEKAPDPGAYPIHDEGHAQSALGLSAGKPEAAAVRAAVYAKFPQMKGSSSK